MIFSLRGITVGHPGAIPHGGNRSHALADITLAIRAGEQVALIGPSGAGKTTLLHTLACAHRPLGGDLSVSGQDPWSLSNAARHTLRAQMFLAPQTPPLPPRQRVVTAVLAGRLPHWSLWQALASLVKPTETQLAYDALARFNLQDKLYARVDRLSGGERQRTGIARLIASAAQSFLVDEPISALDPTLARQTLSVLQQEAASRGAALVCSLHQVDIARERFPRLVGLRDGRIVFDAASSAVSDDMIAALYRHSVSAASTDRDENLLTTAPVAAPRCF
jgi:phosphonate transport system ATP-binding protein